MTGARRSSPSALVTLILPKLGAATRTCIFSVDLSHPMRVTAAAVVRVVSAAVVAAGVWASGAAALGPSSGVTSLRDFGVSRDLSLDDLVGSKQNRLRDRKSERLRGLQIDDQLELGGLLDRKIGRFGTFHDLIDKRRRPAKVFD